MTTLVLNSGYRIEIRLAIEEFAELLRTALERGTLMELTAPDGRRLLLNPSQIALAEGGPSDGAVTRHLVPATAAG